MRRVGHLIGLLVLVTLIQSGKCKQIDRTIYYFPALDDECYSVCGAAGRCLTVKREVRHCSQPYMSYTGKKCMTPCTYYEGDGYKCQINGQLVEYCSLTKKRPPIEHYTKTLMGDMAGPDGRRKCETSCGKWGGTDYNWCRYSTYKSTWDYCSQQVPEKVLESFPSYRFGVTIRDKRCINECRDYGGYTYCSTDLLGNWDYCGKNVDKTVTSVITYQYGPRSQTKPQFIELEYDARSRVNGLPIDKFVVVNTTSVALGNNVREKRAICRGTCLSQTLSDTLDNRIEELDFYIEHALYYTSIVRPPNWSPFVDDGGAQTNVRNSIQRAYVQDITTNVTRVVFLEAEIHQNQFFPNQRLNFRQGDLNWMRSQTNVTAEHEGGHLISSMLGGPPERFNLVPQHRSVNRNYNQAAAVPTWENDWFSVENYMAEFFNPGQPGADGGYINWRVSVHYETDLDYVPQMFQYLATFYDEHHQVIDDGSWFPVGGAMLNDDSPPHHD